MGRGSRGEGAWSIVSDLGSRVDGSANWMMGEHRLRSRFGEEAAWSFLAVLSEVLEDAQGSWVWGVEAQRTGIGVQVVETDLVVEAL